MTKKVFFIILTVLTFLQADEKLEYLYKTHQILSDWIYNTSNKIDTFFARKDLHFNSKNRSYVNLSLNSYLEEHSASQYRLNVKVRIKLPKTQKRYDLVFEDFKNGISTDQQTSSTITDTLNNNSYLFGIELDKIDTKFSKIKFGSGIHFSGIAPDGYISLYLSKIFYFDKNWQFELNNNSKYFFRRHLDDTAQAFVSKVLSDDYKFTFLNSYHYEEENNHINEVVNAVILEKYINAKVGISGSFSMYSSSDDDSNFKLHYYLSKFTYKRFFYHNFAYYTFSPGVIFRKSDNFKPRTRVVFQVGLYFSKFALGGYSKFK